MNGAVHNPANRYGGAGVIVSGENVAEFVSGTGAAGYPQGCARKQELNRGRLYDLRLYRPLGRVRGE